MKHIKIYAVAILALFGVSSISAQDIDEVIKEATVNIDSLITEANNGNEDAILELSFEYYRGKNVEEDEDKAFELAASIADKNEKALLLVANYLYYGAGTAPDQEGAKIILRQLSIKGNEKATSFLAKIEEVETYTVKNL
jgi:TPR repeat protein